MSATISEHIFNPTRMLKLYHWQIISILLLGLILGYAGARVEFALTGRQNTESEKEEIAAENPTPAPALPAPAALDEEDQKLLVDKDGSDPMLGDENAAVTIVEFSDFQCPFCKKYVDDAYLEIKKNYADTGKVKYYIRDFPLSFHPQAKDAAKAANCALEQGKYWEMHDLIFEKQSEWSGNSEAAQLFSGYAKELGLDSKKFEKCTAKEETENEIKNDFMTGSKLGVSGTPTFFINGEKLVGAQPYSAFEEMIEEALEN